MNVNYKLSIKHLRFCLLLIITAGVFISGCGTQTDASLGWQFEGMQEIYVRGIVQAADGMLLLATTDGVFTYKDGRFKRAGLKGEEIEDIVFIEKYQMLAAIRYPKLEANTLFKTTNGGGSWQPHMGNYGGEEGYTYVSELAIHPEKKNILFARGYGNVSRSLDGGQSWKSVHLTWEHFSGGTALLEIDPYRPNIIWAGGATATSDPQLRRSLDGGNNWRYLKTPLENTESDVTSIATLPSDSSSLLIGMASGFVSGSIIRKSTDGGQTWHTVQDSVFTLTMIQSLDAPETVYASGGNATRTLFFLQTQNFGDSWETIEYKDSPADIRVNDMVAVEENGHEVLYLGTNKGVYSYRFDE